MYFYVKLEIPENHVCEFGLYEMMPFTTDLWGSLDTAYKFFYKVCDVVENLCIKDAIVELIRKGEDGKDYVLKREWL